MIDSIKKGSLQECSICDDEMTNVVLTACGCILCMECIQSGINLNQSCPICSFPLHESDFALINTEEITIDLSEYKQSSKTVAIMKKVMEIKEKKEKVVIFTQFIPMIKFIERELQENGVRYCVTKYFFFFKYFNEIKK